MTVMALFHWTKHLLLVGSEVGLLSFVGRIAADHRPHDRSRMQVLVPPARVGCPRSCHTKCIAWLRDRLFFLGRLQAWDQDERPLANGSDNGYPGVGFHWIVDVVLVDLLFSTKDAKFFVA